jgi:multiple antibiotic resistance protein
VDDLARAFVSFFAIIDPVGGVLVFHLFAQRLSGRDRVIAAAVATAAAFLMLLTFALAGEAVLEFLGITQDGFKVAAGLLLLPPAYRLIMEGQPMPAPEGRPLHPFDIALVPLATPLMAGPGALAATISFSDTLGRDVTVAAFTLVLVAALAGFLAAGILFRLLGEPLLKMTARVIGIILFAIAIDFVLEGARAFFDAEAPPLLLTRL